MKATRLVVEADALRNAGGSVSQTGAQSLSVYAGTLANRQDGHIGVPEGSLAARNPGESEPAVPQDEGVVRITRRLDNDGGRIAAASIDLIAWEGLVNDGGTLRLRQFTLAGGELSNKDGSLHVAGPAVVQSDRLLNDSGRLGFANALSFRAGSFSNRGGKLTHTGSDTTALIVDGTFDNSDGQIESDAARLVLSSGTLKNQHGTIRHTGSDGLVLRAGAWLGGAGVLSAMGHATIDAGAVDHRNAMLTARQIDFTAAGFDNRGGAVRAFGDKPNTWTVAGMFDNGDGGKIVSDGSMAIQAGTLGNTRGEVAHVGAGALNIAADTLLGASGSLVSEGALRLSGGAIDLSEGITKAGAVRLSATSLSTARGALKATGNEALEIDVSGVHDNTAGNVAANGAITLLAGSLVNRHGTLRAKGAEASVLRIDGRFDNAGGDIGSGGDTTIRVATLENSNGTVVTRGQLALDTSSVLNGGGRIAADALHATSATVVGHGTLHGTHLLDVHLLGDYTHEAGQQWQGDGVISLKVDGTLINRGALQTQGELHLAASHLVNHGTIQASAVDGSARAHVSVRGRIDNDTGASIAGDTLTLSAGEIVNTSRQGITGNHLRIEADTLVNGRDLGSADAAVAYGEGFIGAARSLDLRIDRQLTNRDGDIYSGGDLTLAGRTDGARTAALDNISGRIQAQGDVRIAADTIANRKRFIETADVALTPAEQHALSSERRYDDALAPAERQRVTQLFERNAAGTFKRKGRGRRVRKNGSGGLAPVELTELMSYLYRSGWARTEHVSNEDLAILNATYKRIAIDEYGARGGYLVVGPKGNPGAAYKHVDTFLTQTRITRESADSQIVAGGNLAIDLGTRLTNAASSIAASGDLLIDGQAPGRPDARIDNLAVKGHYTVRRDVDALVLPSVPVKYLSRRGWRSDLAHFFAHIGTDTRTVDGPVLAPSRITGRSVTLAGRDIGNSAVEARGGIVVPDTAGARHAEGRAARQVVGGADRPPPRLVAPSNGMVTRHTGPDAPFLVTTQPRFAHGGTASSDHLLRSLGTNPWQIHKRLGDGYVEQNLVLDQLLQLTGRRTTDGSDGIAQYTALMDHAAAQALSLGLSLGAPLTSPQIAALSSDIVWLVEQVVEGEPVLVPVVYLSKNTAARMRTDDALIAGHTVDLKASGSVRVDGTLVSSRDTTIDADTVINTGALRAGGRLRVSTRGDALNSGTLDGQGVTIRSRGSVVNAPRMDGLVATGGKIAAGAESVVIVASGDVVNRGIIGSAGDGLIIAGNDYVQDAAAVSMGTQVLAGSLTTGDHATVVAGRDALFDGSTLDAGQQLRVDAGRDVRFRAAAVSGGTGMDLQAGRDIVSDTVTERTVARQWSARRRHSTSSVIEHETTKGSRFTTGGDLAVRAGRDVRLTASEAKADGAAVLAAGRDIDLRAGRDNHGETSESRTVKKKRFAKKTRTTTDRRIGTTVVGTSIHGTNGLLVEAGRDVKVMAATLASEGTVIVGAGNDINLLADTSIGQVSHVGKRRSTGHTYGSKTINADNQAAQQRSVGTTIEGRSGVVLKAGHDVNVSGGTVRSDAGDIAIAAGHEVALRAAYDIDAMEQGTKIRKAGFEHVPNDKQGTRKKNIRTQTVTPQGTTLEAKGAVVVVSGGNQTYQAASIRSGTGTALLSGGTIHFQTATKADTYQRQSSKRNVAYKGNDLRHRADTEEVQSKISGPLTIAAADGIAVDVGRDPRATRAQQQARRDARAKNHSADIADTVTGESEDDAVARLAAEPGHGWIADLRGNAGVNWNLIDETHVNNHRHHEGVTKAAAVVITVVATAVTAGAASAAIGGTLGSASSTFAAAATTTTTSTAAGVGNAILSGAISGAVGGAVNAGSQGYDWKSGARKGAVSGAVSGGLFHQAGTIAGENGWADGTWQKVGLHMASGGTASVSMGGEFWNGALSAGSAEATGPYVDNLPVGTWGRAAGAAASGAAASWLGGGDARHGALNGIAGYLFNESLHPDAARYLANQAEMHARAQCDCDPAGAQIEQARDDLIRTAYRMGDEFYDRVASILGIPFDEAAANYIAMHPLGGVVDGEPVGYFNPDSARRSDPSANGYALYNDKPALAWVQQATGLHDEQLFYNLAATDYTKHPQWLDQYAEAVVKASDNSIYTTVGGAIFSGATGGLGVVSAPWMLGATAGTRVGSIAQYMLTTRTGAGLTNVAVNTTSQALQADDKNPVRLANVAFSFATGALGANGGFRWNTALNAAAGAINTQVNNWLYFETNSWAGGAMTSGITGGVGYLSSDWIARRGGTAHVQRLGPVVLGNAFGAVTAEVAGWVQGELTNKNRESEAASR